MVKVQWMWIKPWELLLNHTLLKKHSL
jgi:hypothetical protein